jgi:hypothetical protein
MRRTEPCEWGRDHWAALAYIESCCVNSEGGIGELDRARMSCNPKLHPHNVYNRMGTAPSRWNDKYSTRLKGHTEDSPVQAMGNDDWSCLEDFEEHGYAVWWSVINGFVQITMEGIELAAAVRAHKANGGSYATFEMAVPA